MMSASYGATETVPISDEKDDAEIEISKPRRRWFSQNALYGLGHMFNDLCAAMWFSYMLLFLQAVLEMRAAVAGSMLLLGQVVDALATPLVGMFADRYSNKKSWHLTGCALVTCTFPLLFVRCWGCHVAAASGYLAWWMPLYYAVLIVFFQIGWAIVQISHLAMIPDITDSMTVRSELTSIRYMASVASSIAVYLITWTVLRATNYSTYITPSDDYKFRDVSIIITTMGVIAFLSFHIFFKLRNKKGFIENGDVSSHKDAGNASVAEVSKAFEMFKLLKMPLLYQASLLYVFSRLYWALSLVYVPLFLEERLAVNPSAGSELVASVPLVLYVASLFTSLLLKSNVSRCSHRTAYLLGSCFSLSACIWIAVTIDPSAGIVQIYLVAGLIGAGSSLTLVSSLCMTANLIEPNSNQGAAIYSIVTFADKLVTGIAVVAIENYKCEDAAACPQYYRGVLTYACGSSVVLGILSLLCARINR